MTATLLCFTAVALEMVLLGRAVRGKLLKRYKFFYCYLAVVLVGDLFLLCIYHLYPRIYAPAYWGTELIGVLVGCGLVWEVYKIAFARYPGASHVARDTLILVFIFAISRVLVEASGNPNWTIGRSTLETELSLRTVQTALLAGLVILFAYYEIPLGRNLKGIIYGYGLFLVTSIANLTLRNDLGSSFQHIWETIQPACYILVLFGWCLTLWSYSPVPDQESEPRLEADYRALVARTRAKLRSTRARLLKDIRP
ncbi:MAG TPA: hypothetical protein VKS44_13840 [Candidatus Acidoferrales bacterium]|nr:hypothetical protein [Candidatus Acidoferrales bacterium]